MIRRIVRPLLLATALGSAFAAQATPVTVSFTGHSVGAVAVALAGPTVETAYPGEFTGQIGGMSFTSFCIELGQSISTPGGPYNNYVLRPLQDDPRFGATQIDRLNRLFTNHLTDSRLDAAHSAGFQLAVWEITYDGASGALDLNAGNFRLGRNNGLSLAAAGFASNYLTGLDGKPTSNLVFEELTSPTRQDQLLARVPAPGTLALALMGVIGWAGSRRARRVA